MALKPILPTWRLIMLAGENGLEAEVNYLQFKDLANTLTPAKRLAAAVPIFLLLLSLLP